MKLVTLTQIIIYLIFALNPVTSINSNLSTSSNQNFPLSHRKEAMKDLINMEHNDKQNKKDNPMLKSRVNDFEKSADNSSKSKLNTIQKSSISEKNLVKPNTKPKVSASSSQMAKCFTRFNNDIYDLNDIEEFQIKENDTEISINICDEISSKLNDLKCNVKGLAIEEEKCVSISTLHWEEKKWEFDMKTNSISIEFPQGDICIADRSKNYILKMNLACDQNADKVKILDLSGVESCHPKVTIAHKFACKAYSYSDWITEFGLNKAVVIMILLVIGSLLLFVGNTLKYLLGFLIVGLIGGIYLNVFIGSGAMIRKIFILVYILTSSGIALYLMFRDDKSILYMCSAIFGFLIGTIIYDVILNVFDTESQIAYWILIVTFAILFVFLTINLDNGIYIITSSVLGSYMIIRAFSLFNDHFPDEGYIYSLFHKRENKQVARIVKINLKFYLLAFILVCLLGVLIQYQNKEDPDQIVEKAGDKKDENEV